MGIAKYKDKYIVTMFYVDGRPLFTYWARSHVEAVAAYKKGLREKDKICAGKHSGKTCVHRLTKNRSNISGVTLEKMRHRKKHFFVFRVATNVDGKLRSKSISTNKRGWFNAFVEAVQIRREFELKYYGRTDIRKKVTKKMFYRCIRGYVDVYPNDDLKRVIREVRRNIPHQSGGKEDGED